MIRVAAAWVMAALFALPLAWMLGTSFKPPAELAAASAAIWPQAPTPMHYQAVAEARIGRAALNSLAVMAGTTLLALAAGFPAAWALARLRFPRRLDLMFLMFVLLVKLAPPIVLSVPLFQVLRALGLLDTLAGLVLAQQILALPFAIWMLLGFVRDVPIAIEEAARMDGAKARPRRRPSSSAR
jgi:multiple sugar transport system permease protein